MKIIVCIKQVPDVADITWNTNNTMVREGVESILNPFDEFALEVALKIKDSTENTTITALTMGPMQSKDILQRAIALGCDDAILVSDKKFAGSDTQATAHILSAAILKKIPDFDLILFGQFAIDGDTGQVGPSVAQSLNLPQITYAKDAILIPQHKILVTKQTEYGIEKLKMQLPGVVCVMKGLRLRKFTISGSIHAQDASIETCTFDDINLSEEHVGIKGSPTYVSKAFKFEKTRNCQFLQDSVALSKLLGGENV